MRFATAILMLCALNVSAQAPVAPAARSIKVAVYDFDQSGVEDNIRRELGGGSAKYGKGAANALLSGLVGGQVRVIDQDQIKLLLEQQNKKFSERFDPSQAVEFGKLLSVDAIVIGSITQLYTEKFDVTNAIGKVIPWSGKYKKVKLVATVELAAKLISTETGETPIAPTREGKFEVVVETEIKADKVDGGQKNSRSTLNGNDPYIRKALSLAAKEIAEVLREDIPKLPPRIEKQIRVEPVPPAPPPPQKAPEPPVVDKPAAPKEYTSLEGEIGSVSKISQGSATILLLDGTTVKEGDQLIIQRAEMMQDARTGKQVAVGEKVGTVVVIESHSQYCKVSVKDGEILEGDRAMLGKRPQSRPKPPSTTATPAPQRQMPPVVKTPVSAPVAVPQGQKKP